MRQIMSNDGNDDRPRLAEDRKARAIMAGFLKPKKGGQSNSGIVERDNRVLTSRSIVRKSKSSHPKDTIQDKMPTQLFDGNNSNENNDQTDALFKERILDQDSVTFEGIVYNKNTCHWLQLEDNSGKKMVVIKHFLRGDSALCMEIIEQKETMLGVMEIASSSTRVNTPTMENLEHPDFDALILRAAWVQERHLSQIGDEIKEIKTVPTWMYIERHPPLLCGYRDTSKNLKRNGPRQSIVKGVDLFSGAGLASEGFERASKSFNEPIHCKIVVGVDKEIDAVQSYANIHHATEMELSSDKWKVVLKEDDGKVAFHGTVKEFLSKYKSDADFRESLGVIDVVIVCSPCQGFSQQNRNKEGNVEQNNNECLRMLDAAELIRPKILVFENVCGIWQKNHIADYIKPITYRLMLKYGYNVQMGLLRAADFGDPQLRERFILVASLSSIGLPVFPQPTHAESILDERLTWGLSSHVTVSDALNPYENMYPEKKDSEWSERKNDERQNPNKPAKCVLASKPAVHHTKNRFYSLEERGIVMGQDLKLVTSLKGNTESKRRQIGNGVAMGTIKAVSNSVFDVLRWNWVGIDEPKQKKHSQSTWQQQQQQQQQQEPNFFSRYDDNGSLVHFNTNNIKEEPSPLVDDGESIVHFNTMNNNNNMNEEEASPSVVNTQISENKSNDTMIADFKDARKNQVSNFTSCSIRDGKESGNNNATGRLVEDQNRRRVLPTKAGVHSRQPKMNHKRASPVYHHRQNHRHRSNYHRHRSRERDCAEQPLNSYSNDGIRRQNEYRFDDQTTYQNDIRPYRERNNYDYSRGYDNRYYHNERHREQNNYGQRPRNHRSYHK